MTTQKQTWTLHSPAPWRMRDGYKSDIVDAQNLYVATGATPDIARLISLAPEMAEALRKVTAYARALERAQGAANDRNITLSAADAVLAKLESAT